MRKLLALIAAVAGLAIGMPATSSAGGWVVVSLDAFPTVHAGEDTEIGFTVLGHGVEPLNADGLAIVVSGPDAQLRFDAVQQGPVGHHVATINLPAEGQYDWSVAQSDGYVAADLGTLAVSDGPSGGSWTWAALQWGSASLAIVMAGLVAVDVRRTRRSSRAVPAPA